MIPNSAELEHLIHSPTGWTEFFRGIEHGKQLQDLLDALKYLPSSSVRDTRISLVLVRLGRYKEAKDLVYQHKNSPLAKAWYFAYLVDEGDDHTLRMILENFRPDWPLGTSLTDLEAKYRAYLSLGIAASSLRRMETAGEMFFKAFTIADALENPQARLVVSFQYARAELYNDNLRASKDRFMRLIASLQENTGIYNQSIEYLSHILWLENTTSDLLPLWCQDTLEALNKNAPILRFSPPPAAVLPYLVPILSDLKILTQEFHAKLPLFHVAEHKANRAALVQRIRNLAGEDGRASEIVGLMGQCALALAESMEHRPEAIERLKRALSQPVSNVSVCNMAYFATLVQLHANLPHVPKTEDVQRAFLTLRQQFKNLPAGQQDWLIFWMRNFTPTALYLLAQQVRHLQVYTQNFVFVGASGATFDGKRIKRYPKDFMTRHVLDLLAGQSIPIEQRHQAHRHRHGIETVGSHCVIYEPVIEVFKKFGNT